MNDNLHPIFQAALAPFMAAPSRTPAEHDMLAEWGERCGTYQRMCPCCAAWRLFDRSERRPVDVPTAQQVYEVIGLWTREDHCKVSRRVRADAQPCERTLRRAYEEEGMTEAEIERALDAYEADHLDEEEP